MSEEQLISLNNPKESKPNIQIATILILQKPSSNSLYLFAVFFCLFYTDINAIDVVVNTVINTPCSYVPGGFAVVYFLLLGLSVFSKVKTPSNGEQMMSQLNNIMRLCYIQSYVTQNVMPFLFFYLWGAGENDGTVCMLYAFPSISLWIIIQLGGVNMKFIDVLCPPGSLFYKLFRQNSRGY